MGGVLIYMQNGLFGLPGYAGLDASTKNPVSLQWHFDGDDQGVIYKIATLASPNSATYVNPQGVASGLFTIVNPSMDSGTIAGFTDRATQAMAVNTGAGAWLGFDLGVGRSLEINKYSIRNRSAVPYCSRSWTLQGSNNVGANSIAGFNAATWTTLDTHTSDTTITAASQWYTIPITPNGAYRWLRLPCTLDDQGSNYFAICEIEFYGNFYY